MVFQTHPDYSLFHDICEFTYYKHITPPPAVLETQDEILLANLPLKWQLVCVNQIDRPVPFNSAIYAIINKNDLCTCGISAQHIFLYESMQTSTNPDTSVTLYYAEKKALLAYDPSLEGKGKSLEQYQITVPEYQAPDIFYMKKSRGNYHEAICEQRRDILTTKMVGKSKRQQRDISYNNEIEKNVTVDDLLSLSFPLLDAVDFMETGKTFYIPSKQQVCKPHVNSSIPLLQDLDFYFNIVTVINFLTSVINAIIISVCYKKCKTFLACILTVVMETMEQNKKVQALKLSDNEITTSTSLDTTCVTSNDTDYSHYSTPCICLIVLLSMLVIFALYWISVKCLSTYITMLQITY